MGENERVWLGWYSQMYAVVLGGVVMVVGSNLSIGKIFTASIGSVHSLYIRKLYLHYISMYLSTV